MKYNRAHVAIDKQDILENFDFNRVKITMKALKWTWVGYPVNPSIEDLKEKASVLIDSAVDKLTEMDKNSGKLWLSTGGFSVSTEKFKKDPKIYITLEFVVSEWSNKE